MPRTFLWHDYETFGRDPARERPVQFAAIRTDENLEEIDSGIMIYCRQSPDYLPDPGSCAVHGVIPQLANEKGLSEWEFANAVHNLMSVPETCTVGFNSIRFDDEFTRQMLFRNLFDPYSREWRNKNSRWDLIDVVRLARALRPDGIEWPTDAEGKPTNKLELITAANGIEHGDAHDALADVRATIAVARLLKEKQPKLFDYAYSTRNKRWVLSQGLDLINKKEVLHISGMYPAVHGHISLIIPLGPHPTNANGVIAYDLRHPPDDLIRLSKEDLKARIFTSAKDLPEGTSRIAVKTIHANRCPILAPAKMLDEETAVKWQINQKQCQAHKEQLLAAPAVIEKLAWVFSQRDLLAASDPDLTLYSGQFASEKDRTLMTKLHKLFQSGGDLPDPQSALFEDTRLDELYFRLIARNWPERLDSRAEQRWLAFCHSRVHQGAEGFRPITEFKKITSEMTNTAKSTEDINKIKQLEEYGEQIANFSKR